VNIKKYYRKNQGGKKYPSAGTTFSNLLFKYRYKEEKTRKKT
jgi:hypothetical protein